RDAENLTHRIIFRLNLYNAMHYLKGVTTRGKRPIQSTGRGRRRSVSAAGGGRRSSVATQTQTPTVKDPFGDMQVKVLDAMVAYGQTNQRVLGELINLSSAAMKETLRVLGELESAAIDAARTAPAAPTAPVSVETFAKDPLAGYRQ